MGRPSEDLTGQRFGRWVTVERVDSDKHGNTKWKCVCDCGKEKNVIASSLKTGDTKSCGCINKELTSIRMKGHAYTKGNIYAKGNTHSRIDPEESFWNIQLMSYKGSAKARGYEFSLSKAQFIDISSQNCHYCDAIPKDNTIAANDYKRKCIKKGTNFDQGYYNSKIVKTNGIDRVDNSLGYTSLNVVACCAICNMAKNDNSSEEFENWILIAAETINKRRSKKYK